MLSTRSPELIYLITESLYFLTNISPHLTPDNHSFSLFCFSEFSRRLGNFTYKIMLYFAFLCLGFI